MKDSAIGKIIGIVVNLFVIGVFFNATGDEKFMSWAQEAWFVPTIIIGINLALIYYNYSNASFIYRIVDGYPHEIAALGSKEAWQKFVRGVNKETNAFLRSKGVEPYSFIFQSIASSRSPLQPVLWLTEVGVAVAFIYLGWFWTGLSVLICTVVQYRSAVYLRSREAQVTELAKS
jgi:hypothetical protein